MPGLFMQVAAAQNPMGGTAMMNPQMAAMAAMTASNPMLAAGMCGGMGGMQQQQMQMQQMQQQRMQQMHQQMLQQQQMQQQTLQQQQMHQQMQQLQQPHQHQLQQQQQQQQQQQLGVAAEYHHEGFVGYQQHQEAAPVTDHGHHQESYAGEVVATVMRPDSEEDKDMRYQDRIRQRRMKLAGYLAEEVANTMGDHRDRYLSDMRKVLAEASSTTREAYLTDKLEEPNQATITQRVPRVLGPLAEPPEFGGWNSEPVQEHMELIGELGPSRHAWCKWWDPNTGCGELVDVDDESAIAVVSAALTTAVNVSPRLKYLRHGEFVEYRRVDRGQGQIARAVLVRGLKGWPLMCEVDGARALKA